MFKILLSWVFLNKKTFFSLTEVSVFSGCWTQACSLIACISCLYHIWGVSDTCVRGQKCTILDRKFLTLSLLPCPPKSLWGHSFVPSSFYLVWCRLVKSNPWVTGEVLIGTPDTECSLALAGDWGGVQSPGWKRAQVPAEGQADVALQMCCCHRAQCVSQSAAVHAPLGGQWPSLAALCRAWFGFLWVGSAPACRWKEGVKREL